MNLAVVPVEPNVVAPGTGTALVVDDSAVNRALLRSLLERRGYVVEEAADGEPAVQRFIEGGIDIVFMDVLMPGMDGYAATREIRRYMGDRYVPVIFLTSLTSTNVLEECVAAGGDEFFGKPFDAAQLDARLTVIERLKVMHDTIREQRNSLADHHARDTLEREIAEAVMARVVRTAADEDSPLRATIRGATMFSGDLVLCARTPDGLHRILIGDVTGHGLPASVAGLVAATSFQDSAANGSRLAGTIRQLNRRVREVLPDGVFLAASVLEADLRRGIVRAWHGGMLPLAIVREKNGSVQWLDSWCPPLGILEDGEFVPKLRELPVATGDRLVCVSDGVVEARNARGEDFGEVRLRTLVEDGGVSIHDTILAAFDRFVGDGDLEDDVTVVEIRVPSPESPDDAPSGHRPPGAWEQRIRVEGAALRHQDPLTTLGFILSDTGLPPDVRERVMTVGSEMVANALDHGVLDLPSSLKEGPEGMLEWLLRREEALEELESGRRAGHVDVDIRYRGTNDGACLRLRVSDSGSGFDPSRVSDPEREAHSGRGIRIMRDLCTELVHGPGGSWVEGVFRW